MFRLDLARRSGRSLRSAKGRTLLTAMAIGVGTFALTLTLAASNGAQAFVDDIISNNFDPAELIVAKDKTAFGRGDLSKPQEYDDSFAAGNSQSGAAIQVKKLTDDDLQKLRNYPEVEEVREGLDLRFQYITRQDQKRYVATGIAFSPSMHPDLLAGSIPRPLGNKQLILPEGYLESLGFKDAASAIGKPITIAMRKSFDPAQLQAQLRSGAVTEEQINKLTQDSTQEFTFTIAAVTKKMATNEPGTELYIFIGIEDARELNNVATANTPDYHKYLYSYVRIKDGADNAKLKLAQDKIKADGYEALSVEDTQKFLNQIIGVLRGIVAAFGFIAVIASVFGIINTMYISVLQRTREIGLMKALGMHKRDIGKLFRLEAAWIGFLGGALGSLLAIGLGALLNPAITKALKLDPDQHLLIFKPIQVVVLILILIAISTLAGYLPSRKASKQDPIEALRTE